MAARARRGHVKPLIILPEQAPGLIVGGKASRRVQIVIEFECACVEVLGQLTIDRMRLEDGRWMIGRTVYRRLQALGGKPIDVKVVGAGEHAPIY